jgi:hypothetical protein
VLDFFSKKKESIMVYPKPGQKPSPSRISNVQFSGATSKTEEPNKHVNPKLMERLMQLQNILLKVVF